MKSKSAAAPSTPAPAQTRKSNHKPLESFIGACPGLGVTAAPAPEPEDWLRREIKKRVEVFVRDVAELPDRCSPDDWPEAMLVTDAELAEMIRCELNDFARAYRASLSAQKEK